MTHLFLYQRDKTNNFCNICSCGQPCLFCCHVAIIVRVAYLWESVSVTILTLSINRITVEHFRCHSAIVVRCLAVCLFLFFFLCQFMVNKSCSVCVWIPWSLYVKLTSRVTMIGSNSSLMICNVARLELGLSSTFLRVVVSRLLR